MRSFLCWALAAGAMACAGGSEIAVRSTVADSCRPQTWFHVIGGNASKEGLTADLEAIAAAGFGGIQFFHGQIGPASPWPRTHGQIPCLGAAWDGLVRHAADECARLGLKFEMQNCPGWSMSGGPWITPETAERKLVAFRPERRPAFGPDDDFREIGRVSFPKPAGWDEPDPVPAAVETNGDTRVYRFAAPVTVRTLELPRPRSFNSRFAYEKWLRVRFEAKTADGWRTVVDRDYPRGCWQDDEPVSFACGETAAEEWRLTFTHAKPIRAVEFVRFRAVAKIDNAEALAGRVFREFARGLAETPRTEGRAELVFGHVNMKWRNAPAPAEATGWECDKLDPKGFRANFAGYLGRLLKGPLAGGRLKGMVVDSWECGRPNWTEGMERRFAEMNGYALRPNLPALFGYAVRDAASTERFLRDWRRTVSRLIEENYYRVFSQMGREAGLTVQFETAFQDVLPGDPLRYWKYAEIPMCEFWQPLDNAKGGVGSDNYKPVRPCVSAAHVYGRRRVQAEALTSLELTYDEDFNLFKRAIDHAFARGVTHLVFHTYTHNPQVGADFLPPGTSFEGGIGSPFLRGQSWWRFMPHLTGYVTRCGRELERGFAAVDVLWYLGDDNPYRPDEHADFPKGYKYDYITQDALLERLAAKDGRLVLPDGMSYRMLWIPDGTLLLPASAAKVAALERAGAKVCRGKLRIDWESPLGRIGRADEPGLEWYARRDGDEEIFFLAEADGSSRFVYRNAKTGCRRTVDPSTGETCPPDGTDARAGEARKLGVRPAAAYPAWALERDYVAAADCGAEKPAHARLDLGAVRSWAEVSVNGEPVRTLWSAPYVCDIASWLRPGANKIRIRVTSTWYNRLVRDAGLPEADRRTWTLAGPKSDAPLHPSGLLGPVTLTLRKSVP